MRRWILWHLDLVFRVCWFAVLIGAGVAFAHYANLNATTLTLGASGTSLTQVRVYAPSLTPAGLAAAIGVTEQTFSVVGLTTADKVIVNGPAPTALCPMVAARVTGADTLGLSFADLTIALCTPAAGTYTVVAIRS